jgi:hypothetical protein
VLPERVQHLGLALGDPGRLLRHRFILPGSRAGP